MNLVQLRATLIDFVQPLDAVLTAGPERLGVALGYDFAPVKDSLTDITDALTKCSTAMKTFAADLMTVAEADEVTPATMIALGTSATECISAYRDLYTAFDGAPSTVTNHLAVVMDGGSSSDFAEEFATRLVGWLTTVYLDKQAPQLRSAFNVVGLLTQELEAGDPARYRLPCVASRLRLEAIPELVSNPKRWLVERYTVGGQVSLDLLTDCLHEFLLTQMYYTSRIRPPHASLSSVGRLLPSAALASSQPRALTAEIVNSRHPELHVAARIVPLLGAATGNVGLVAEVEAQGSFGDFTWAPSENVALSLSTDASAGMLARAVFFSGASPKLEFVSSGAVNTVRAAMAFRTPPSVLDVSIRGVGGFKIDRLAVVLGTKFDGSSHKDFFGEVHLSGAELQIGGSSADGFLKQIFPGQGLHGTFDIAIGCSSERGLYATGSGGLELTLPIQQNIGPVRLESIYVATLATPPDLELRAGISMAAKIGPVAASVERIGARLLLPLSGGDPAIRFLPPIGAGLGIDAGGISGGGYVAHDEALGRYAGILDLKFGDIGLVAIGIITTKLPGGKDGFALYVNIGVTFSPPITLPYNFNLQGCGGLLALNRTMDTDALRSGLKKGTLDSILFPENPILNASKIISDSERVFPIEEGRFVIGPMVKLGWGSGGLVSADIAIIIEIPSPIVIAVLGQFTAKIPKASEAKVEIHIDVLGVLDVAKKELSIDASIYNSRIVAYDLSGDSALRLSWGSPKVFALSLGGFHPRFSPPPKFPKLKRLTLELSSSNSFELVCTVYHALTSNSLQLGARIQLHAEACGAELNGHLSFDGMIIFSPFAFDVGISGGVGVSYKGRDLASVHLSFDLSGPNPWHAKGKASFSVACFDVDAKFNRTWGNDNGASLAKIDPLPLFREELEEISNWNATVIPRRSAVESLKSLEPGSGSPPFLAHPAGGLEVRQRLLPLGIKLELLRNAEVKNHFRFDVRLELLRGTEPIPPDDLDPEDDVKEHFARGQYKELSKSDRLSTPSYEKFRAGVRATPKLARLDGRIEPVTLQFESILIYPDGYTERQPRASGPDWEKVKRVLRAAALRKANARRRDMGRFISGAPPRVRVEEEGYVIVEKATLQRVTAVHAESDPTYTFTEAIDRVEDAVEAGIITADSVTVVPEFEVQTV